MYKPNHKFKTVAGGWNITNYFRRTVVMAVSGKFVTVSHGLWRFSPHTGVIALDLGNGEETLIKAVLWVVAWHFNVHIILFSIIYYYFDNAVKTTAMDVKRTFKFNQIERERK